MREVGFDLPLGNPKGAREFTSIPRTNSEQCDDLLSQCRLAACHRSSSLHAYHLVGLVHHLYQILLVAHDLLNILVSLRQFVKHRGVLAALDTENLHDQVYFLEAVARLRPAHAASGAVRTRMKGLWITLTTDDERAGSHPSSLARCRILPLLQRQHLRESPTRPSRSVPPAGNSCDGHQPEKVRHRPQKACVFEAVLGDILEDRTGCEFSIVQTLLALAILYANSSIRERRVQNNVRQTVA